MVDAPPPESSDVTLPPSVGGDASASAPSSFTPPSAPRVLRVCANNFACADARISHMDGTLRSRCSAMIVERGRRGGVARAAAARCCRASGEAAASTVVWCGSGDGDALRRGAAPRRAAPPSPPASQCAPPHRSEWEKCWSWVCACDGGCCCRCCCTPINAMAAPRRLRGGCDEKRRALAACRRTRRCEDTSSGELPRSSC